MSYSSYILFSLMVKIYISWAQLKLEKGKASQVAQMVKNIPTVQETWVWSLGKEDSLEKGVANHSSILVWRIPWTENPGGLQSMGCKELDTAEWLTHACWIQRENEVEKNLPWTEISIFFVMLERWPRKIMNTWITYIFYYEHELIHLIFL